MIDFLKELQRRKVWLFGGIYLALGWVILQVAIAVEATLALPGWVDQITLVLLGLGFPVALLLAWAQESGAQADNTKDARKTYAPDRRPSFSIAVLPFDNLSGDPVRDGLAEGLAEDIITLLSGYLGLNVTARNSSFQFKGQAIDLREIGSKLNVRYLLEGSLRPIGANLRITAQLIDTETGDHVWADRYDVPIETIEKEQDQVIDTIFTNVGDVTLVREIQRLRRESVETLTGDEIANIADFLLFKSTRKHVGEAVDLLKSAVEKQPGSAMAHAYLAYATNFLPAYSLGGRIECSKIALREADKALELAPTDPTVLACVSLCHNAVGDHERALKMGKQAVELGPKNFQAHKARAQAYAETGDYDAAVKDHETALDLISTGSPYHSQMTRGKAWVLFHTDQFERAAELASDSLMRGRSHAGYSLAIASLGHLGRNDDAAKLIQEYLIFWPEATIKVIEKVERGQSDRPGKEKYLENLITGLRLAGLE